MDDETFQRLVMALTSSKPSVEELLIQLGENNPRAQAVAQLLINRRNQSEEEPREDLEDNRLGLASQGTESRRNKLQILRDRILDLREERNELWHHNNALAKALGACLCWGADPHCRSCHGRGAPGYILPDRALFEKLVVPAISRYRSEDFSPSSSKLMNDEQYKQPKQQRRQQ